MNSNNFIIVDYTTKPDNYYGAFDSKTQQKYADNRCLNQFTDITEEPWYRMTDKCLCDPKLNNPTGRGYTVCPFGVEDVKNVKKETIYLSGLEEVQGPNGYYAKPVLIDGLADNYYFPKGTMTPPQLDPRPLTMIGNEWRNGY